MLVPNDSFTLEILYLNSKALVLIKKEQKNSSFSDFDWNVCQNIHPSGLCIFLSS